MSGKWLDIMILKDLEKKNPSYVPTPQDLINNNIRSLIKYKKEIDKTTGQEILKKSVCCSRSGSIEKKINKESIKRKSTIAKFGICKKQILGKIETGITTPCSDELSYNFLFKLLFEKVFKLF